MDSLINASARALARGDALGALKHVALRNDPPALALRGIAMAQLGDLARARELLRRAARGFGRHEPLAHARCVAAEAEVALALRDLAGPPRVLEAAADTLAGHGDRANASQARLTATRQWLLLGRLDEAAAGLAATDTAGLSPALTAVASLCAAELAMRSLQMAAAQAALARAHAAAQRAGIPALQAEVAEAQAALDRAAGRQLSPDGEKLLRLDEASALLASDALVLDACRRAIACGAQRLPLARRPVLFMLADALARAWPGDAGRDALIAHAFRQRDPDDTHRARLRVEIGRLRALVKPFAAIDATPAGFALRPPRRAARGRAGPTHRGRRRGPARAAVRRRRLVHVGTGPGAGRKPAHRAARAGRLAGSRPRARHRPRAVTALAGAAAGGIHDSPVAACIAAL